MASVIIRDLHISVGPSEDFLAGWVDAEFDHIPEERRTWECPGTPEQFILSRVLAVRGLERVTEVEGEQHYEPLEGQAAIDAVWDRRHAVEDEALEEGAFHG